MQNTLVHAQYVPMDPQWAVFVASVVQGPLQTLVNRIVMYKGVIVKPLCAY